MKKLINDYEYKVFTLNSIVSRKSQELNERYRRLNIRKVTNSESIKNSEERFSKLLKEENGKRFNKRRRSSSYLETARNEELERNVVIMEIQNRIGLEDLEKLKETIKKVKNKEEIIESDVSEISIALLKTYNISYELQKTIIELRKHKNKFYEVLKPQRNEGDKLIKEQKNITTGKNNLTKKKSKLSELQTIVDNQVLKLKKLGDDYEALLIQIKQSKECLNNYKKLQEKTVENIQEKIIKLEQLVEKVKTQEQLIVLRTSKVRNDSNNVFNKSKDIFELLKTLDKKSAEICQQIKESEKKARQIQEKIVEFKTQQEEKERVSYFREKIIEIKKGS
ncbi:hypothetical protein SteCoe_11541 [Stentor coeruleus]|uniref:DUF4201 domain-containing protein n=1 Tax=Stentor coeruleus TaxID=5963 RepID=A0A1R2CCV4_9CILI|nr:hypothetical protein SteCoe_11541 [Stentor coeruleus]